MHDLLTVVSSLSVYRGTGVKTPVIPDLKLLGGRHINMSLGTRNANGNASLRRILPQIRKRS